MSVEVNNIQATINAPLPPPPSFGIGTSVKGLMPHGYVDTAYDHDVSDSSTSRTEVQAFFYMVEIHSMVVNLTILHGKFFELQSCMQAQCKGSCCSASWFLN